MISGVDAQAMTHAWSQKRCSYSVASTSGKHAPSEHSYEAKFEDEWGNTNFKSVPCPDIIHFYHEHAPFIDKHNKARQSVLPCKRRWSTWNA